MCVRVRAYAQSYAVLFSSQRPKLNYWKTNVERRASPSLVVRFRNSKQEIANADNEPVCVKICFPSTKSRNFNLLKREADPWQ